MCQRNKSTTKKKSVILKNLLGQKQNQFIRIAKYGMN